MIQEDYVSFEIAKLLKEKGFEGRMHTFYTEEGTDIESLYVVPSNFFPIYRPTLQMTMKWLREVHDIDIEVRTHYLNRLKENDIRYYIGKILKGSEDVIHTIYAKDTYEEVCETAIKYCLENLI